MFFLFEALFRACADGGANCLYDLTEGERERYAPASQVWVPLASATPECQSFYGGFLFSFIFIIGNGLYEKN